MAKQKSIKEITGGITAVKGVKAGGISCGIKKEGVKELKVQILSDNIAMKKMLEKENFTLTPSEKTEGIINAHLQL